MTFQVESVERRRTITELWLSTASLPDLQAGDLVELQPVTGWHSSLFSIAGYDADYDKPLQVRLFVSPRGNVSRWLAQQAEVGDTIEGNFISGDVFRPTAEHSLCIATGTGVAPFLLARERCCVNSLVWGIRHIEDYQFAPTLEKCVVCFSQAQDQSSACYKPNKSLWQHLGRVQSYLEYSMPIGLQSSDTYYKHIYICGHTEMIADVTTLLIERGYPRQQIESEVFFT